MRLSSKAFVVDGAGRLLLLDCADPDRPDVRWWELPGGGVEPGEDEVGALVREVLEETGLVVDAAVVGPLQWTQESTFLFRSVRRWSRCHGRLVRLTDPGPARAPRRRPCSPTTSRARSWACGGGRRPSWPRPATRFFPRHVPALLPRLLAGERVDEPFDAWD